MALRRHGSDEPLWENGEPTNYGIEVYTEGDCWALAWHVARLTGGRIHTVGRQPDEWEHVVVEVAPCLYLDATGVRSGTEVRQTWGGRLIPLDAAAVCDLASYTAALGAEFVFLAGHGEAAEFARLLLAREATDRGAAEAA